MSERTYYVLCDDNCRFESMTKEQIIAAIAEATGETPTHIDDAFITKIKELNKNAPLQYWIGTTAQYNAIETKQNNTLYILTDEYDSDIDDLKADIRDIYSRMPSVLNDIYPVGSIYMSVNSVNPSTIFGGTWQAWGAGRVPIGVGTGTDERGETQTFAANETGGNYKKKLGITDIPEHRHSYSKAGNTTQVSDSFNEAVGGGYYVQIVDTKHSTHSHGISHSTEYTPMTIFDANAQQVSQNNGFSMLNPYITCYMWVRTA